MPVHAVFFDIGGVLENNPPTGWPERWAARLGFEIQEFERLVSGAGALGEIGGESLEEIERTTAEVLCTDARTVTELMEDMWLEYVGILDQELTDYFAQLRPTYKTGLLSNSFVGAREREQEAHGLGDLCDVIVYSHEEGLLKPDPRIYLIACERLDVTPGSAVLLDDVQANVDGAIEAGMQGVTYINIQQAITELGALLACEPPRS